LLEKMPYCAALFSPPKIGRVDRRLDRRQLAANAVVGADAQHARTGGRRGNRRDRR
jgi:hypothetical protein